MSTSRRGFLGLLLATPLIVRPGIMMPVKPALIPPAPPAFLPGDLVSFVQPHVSTPGSFIGARVVDRVEGVTAYVWSGSYGHWRAAEPVPVATLTLFEGLSGNRVNNPSARSRLIHAPGELGLRYAEDFQLPARSALITPRAGGEP